MFYWDRTSTIVRCPLLQQMAVLLLHQMPVKRHWPSGAFSRAVGLLSFIYFFWGGGVTILILSVILICIFTLWQLTIFSAFIAFMRVFLHEEAGNGVRACALWRPEDSSVELLLLPHHVGLSSAHRVWLQAPSQTEPSCQPNGSSCISSFTVSCNNSIAFLLPWTVMCSLSACIWQAPSYAPHSHIIFSSLHTCPVLFSSQSSALPHSLHKRYAQYMSTCIKRRRI